MLKQITFDASRAVIKLKDAKYPAPFEKSLEFSAPARGTWNIVHTGMLLPSSHQIYICAAGCLRGVILTAAEMGAMDRFSSLEVKERDLVAKDHEKFIIDGITHILNELPVLPRAVLVFTACVHHFLGTNLRYVYEKLRQNFPSVDFAECVMDPIRQTESITPEERERREIFRLLKNEDKTRQISIIGGNLAIDEDSELIKILKAANFKIIDFPRLKNYDEFLSMGKSVLNIYQNPFTHIAAKEMKERIKQDYLYLPIAYDEWEIEKELNSVASALNIAPMGFSAEKSAAHSALKQAKSVIKDAPVAIDLTFTHRPFHLARVLAEKYDFNVTHIFSDGVTKDDEDDFLRLKKIRPEILLVATKHADARFFKNDGDEKILALGQKAAYFLETPYFVNFVEGGGLWGYNGLKKLANLMIEAFNEKKDLRIIEKKAWSAPSCLE